MDSSTAPRAGALAPGFRVRADGVTLTLASLDKQPVVLVFLTDWSPASALPDDLAAVRAELRGLGAVLVVLSDVGLFLFRPDDEVERFARAADLDLGDVHAAHAAFGLKRCASGSLTTPALFVIDGNGVLRFAHVWRTSDDVGLDAVRNALSAAGRAVVAGFALMFLDACDKPEAGKPAVDAATPVD